MFFENSVSNCKHGRDWRGGVAVAVGNGGESRNPGKPLKNGLLAIFYDGFSGENPRAVMQRFDAPSLALFVLKKWQDVLWGHLPCADESAAIKNSKIFFMLAQEE